MSAEKSYEFEHYEKYVGDAEDVIGIMEDCPACGVKMVLTHYSDAPKLVLHETAKCLECDYGQRRTLYILN